MVNFRSLRDVEGEELGSVCFVRDYIELIFDGPLLRVFSPLTIQAQQTSLSVGDIGFRDALCGLIGLEIAGTQEDDDRLALSFRGHAVLIVPLAWLSTAPEAAHFVRFYDGRLQGGDMRIWENQTTLPFGS
jgi:hypothetical protein